MNKYHFSFLPFLLSLVISFANVSLLVISCQIYRFQTILEPGSKNSSKCSDRSMEVKLLALLKNHDIQTDRPIYLPLEGYTGLWKNFTSHKEI